MGAVDIKLTAEHELTLEWDSSAGNDMIADSCMALIVGIDSSPASVKCKYSSKVACMTHKNRLPCCIVTTHTHTHPHTHPHADKEEDDIMQRLQKIAAFLEAHFGDISLLMPEAAEGADHEDESIDGPAFIVRLDDAEAKVNLTTMVRFATTSSP